MEKIPGDVFIYRTLLGRLKSELAEIADDIPLGKALRGKNLLLGKITAKVLSRWLPDEPKFSQLEGLPPFVGETIDILQEYNRLLDPHDQTITFIDLDKFLISAANFYGGWVMPRSGLPKDPYVRKE